jgi:hypothetical protein
MAARRPRRMATSDDWLVTRPYLCVMYPVTSSMSSTSRINTSQQLFCKTGISIENKSFLIDTNDLSNVSISVAHDLEYDLVIAAVRLR